MKPEPNNQQLNWVDRAMELNDTEAAQINGGRQLYSTGESQAHRDVTESANTRFTHSNMYYSTVDPLPGLEKMYQRMKSSL